MYFDSNTKLVIFGAVILLLAGIIVGRRRGLMAGLFFSVSFCIIFLVLLAVGLLLCLGRPPVIFYYFFLFLLYLLPGLFLLKLNLKIPAMNSNAYYAKMLLTIKTISVQIVVLT